MQGALRARLIAAAPVTALVGQRVYWVDRPQASALPSITLQIVSDPRPQHLKGFQKLRETRVQVDIWGKTSLECAQIKEAVIPPAVAEGANDGVVFNRGLIDGGRTGGEQAGTQFIHRSSFDLIVWWSVA
jgi:hypothetical protein